MAASSTVVVVLGHRDSDNAGVHVISDECAARVRAAARLAARRRPAAVVLCGASSTPQLSASEAAQMAALWPLDEVAVVLEETSLTTAHNAAQALALIRLMPGVRRVVVVSSCWHLRARFFFASYRRFGLRVSHRPVWRWRRPRRALRNELRFARTAVSERAAAYADAGR